MDAEVRRVLALLAKVGREARARVVGAIGLLRVRREKRRLVDDDEIRVRVEDPRGAKMRKERGDELLT